MIKDFIPVSQEEKQTKSKQNVQKRKIRMRTKINETENRQLAKSKVGSFKRLIKLTKHYHN